MPTFEIEANGKTYEVEAPDMKSAAGALSSVKPAESSAQPAEGGIGQALKSGVTKGAIGLLGLPGDLSELGARGIDRATRYVSDKLGVEAPVRPDQAPTYGSADVQKAAEGVGIEAHKYKPQTRGEKYAETIGEFAPGLIGGGGVGALARRAITNVIAPAVGSEAAGQFTEGTKAEPYARVAGALAGGVAPSALGRAVTPIPISDARQRLVNVLQDEGVTSLTAGQRTGNEALRYAESTLGNAPLSGQRANAVAREGQEQFTDAALRRAGTEGAATPETLAANNQRLGDTFRDLSARNTLVMDPQFGNELGAALRTYDRVPNSQQKAIVQGYADDIIQHAQQGGTMPGTFYQEMRSRLSRQSNGLRQSDPTLSDTLRQMRDALDGAMSRSISPADREAWNTARREYGAQKVVEKAASRAGEATAEGQIVPANLRNTVSAENRGAYARGQGQFSELARAGAGVMGQPPQSGTAPRAMINNLAGLMTNPLVGAAAGGGAGYSQGGFEGAAEGAAAGLLGPAALGRLLMSRPAQGYLANQVATPALQHLNARQAAIVAALMASQQQRLAPPR